MYHNLRIQVPMTPPREPVAPSFSPSTILASPPHTGVPSSPILKAALQVSCLSWLGLGRFWLPRILNLSFTANFGYKNRFLPRNWFFSLNKKYILLKRIMTHYSQILVFNPTLAMVALTLTKPLKISDSNLLLFMFRRLLGREHHRAVSGCPLDRVPRCWSPPGEIHIHLPPNYRAVAMLY